ncbi:hypothetical protein OROMI_006389 [Orobanche minor]
MVILVVTRKWLNRIMMGEIVWTFVCQRYLQVPDPGNVTFKLIKIYATSFAIGSETDHSRLTRPLLF